MGKKWENLYIIYTIFIIKKLGINLENFSIKIENPKMLKKISSDLIKSIERSNKQINMIPSLDYVKIKERILESFIESIKKN